MSKIGIVVKKGIKKIRKTTDHLCHPQDDYMFTKKECREFNESFLEITKNDEQSRKEFKTKRKNSIIDASKKCKDFMVNINGKSTNVCKWTRLQ